MTYILGLTGGISSGKTNLSDYFRELNIPVADGDEIARKVVEKDSPTLQKIIKIFGKDYLKPDGTLNRKKLGHFIFANPKARKQLDELMAKSILSRFLQEIKRAKEKNVPLLVLDVPLLYEAGYQRFTNEVMVAYLPENLQLQRLMTRDNITEKEALQRIQSQMPLLEKKQLADIVIDTSGSKEESRQQVTEWLIKKGFFEG